VHIEVVSLVFALIMQRGEEMGIYALKNGCMFVCAHISFLVIVLVLQKEPCLSCNKALKIDDIYTISYFSLLKVHRQICEGVYKNIKT